MKDSKTFWDKRAEKYSRSPIKDQATYQRKLEITQEYLNSDSQLLEFGCGSGGTAIYHAPFVRHVVATDISGKMIEIAKQKAIEAGIGNIHFQQGTLDCLDADGGSFDVVLGLNVLHLLDDVDGAIQKVYQLLKKDGVFVSSTSLIGEVNRGLRWLISAMQLLGMAPYVSRFTKDQLIAKLKAAGFCVEREWRSSSESVFIVARKI